VRTDDILIHPRDNDLIVATHRRHAPPASSAAAP